uniref:Uncharacterized protein n=1 Tax=Micrurus paraensis TaxID=1970185 RepID=A0A2D4L1N0_9SAUR
MEGFQGPKIPPGGREAVLQEFPTTLALSLEQLDVTSQPGHKGPDNHVRHLRELVMQEGCGCVVCHLLEDLIAGLRPYIKLAIFRVDVFMETFDYRPVDEEASHHDYNF